MSEERSFDHFVDTLEKRARAARTISVAITVGVIVIGLVVVSVTIWQIRKRINQEKQELAKVTDETAQAKAELADTRSLLDKSRREVDSYEKAVEVLPPGDKNAVLQKVDQLSQQDATKSTAPPSVFPQVMDRNQIPQATAVCAKLKVIGVKVQDVDRVPSKVSLNQTLVKYFRPEYADYAQKIVDVLKQSGVQAAPVAVTDQAGQIEIWFSANAFPNSTTASQSNANAALAKAADDVMFEFFEALRRSEDKNEATNRMQRIVAQLERDSEAAPYVKASGVSSKDTTALINGLKKIRSAVASDKKGNLLDKINKLIVDIGQPSYKMKS